jgi:parallel beta-helix repeat protein
VESHTHIYDSEGSYKFGFGVFNFELLGNGINQVGFDIVSEESLEAIGNELVFEGNITVDFSDIARDYELLVGVEGIEISGNFGKDLWLDPSVEISEYHDEGAIYEDQCDDSTWYSSGFGEVSNYICDGDFSVYEEYSWVEFDVSEIPAGSTIDDVVFDYTVDSTDNIGGCNFGGFSSYRPSESSASEIASEIGSNDYIDTDSDCTSTGTYQLDLDSSADSDLEYQVADAGSDKWFAILIWTYTDYGNSSITWNDLEVEYTPGSDLYECATLDYSATYSLGGDIDGGDRMNTYGTPCFNITADDVTLELNNYVLDCEESSYYSGYAGVAVRNGTSGFSITGDGAIEDCSYGILVEGGVDDIDIGTGIETGGSYKPNEYDVYFDAYDVAGDITNVYISGNTFQNSTSDAAIYFDCQNGNCSDITIRDNEFRYHTNGGAVYIQCSDTTCFDINISENKIENVTGEGIYLYCSGVGCMNSFVFDNTVNNSGGGGIYFSNVSGSEIYGNILYNATGGSGYGISVSGSKNNRVYGNVITDSYDYNAVSLYGVENITFARNNISRTSSGSDDLGITDSNGTILEENIFTDYDFTDVEITINHTRWGKIEFLDKLSPSQDDGNFTKDIVFGNNSIYVNVNSTFTDWNQSANLTLYGTPGIGLTTPAILRDGSLCTNCPNP